MKYPFGCSNKPTQLQIYLQKIVLAKQTDVLLSCCACMEPMAVAGFFTSEYKTNSSLAATHCELYLKLGHLSAKIDRMKVL